MDLMALAFQNARAAAMLAAALLAAAPSPAASPAVQPALPGNAIGDIRPYVPAEHGFAVAAEAAEAPMPEELEGGWHNVAKQEFKVIEFPLTKNDKKTLFITYQYKAPLEEPVAKGRRVLWVCHGRLDNDNNSIDGLKAFEDAPETRQAVAEAFARSAPKTVLQVGPARFGSGGNSLLMHGWNTAMRDVLQRRSRVVALCQAERGGGVQGIVNGPVTFTTWQPFRVLQVFEGDSESAEAEVIFMHRTFDERSLIPEWEKVIWIAEPMLGIPAPGDRVDWYGESGGVERARDNVPRWNGLKALRDTPENRRLLGLPDAGAPPAARAPGKPAAPLKLWTDEETARQYGVRKGEPIESGFVFVEGRYLKAPYTVRRQGADIFINDVRATFSHFVPVAPDFFPDKPPAPPGLGPETTFADLDLPGTLGDSWDRRMVRWMRRQQANPRELINGVLDFYKGLPFIKDAHYSPRERNELVLETVRGEQVTINVDIYSIYLKTKADAVSSLDHDCGYIEGRLRKGDALFYFDGTPWLSFGGDKAAVYMDLMLQALASQKTDEEKAEHLRGLFAETKSWFGTEHNKVLVREFRPSPDLRDRVDKILAKER